MSIKRHGWGGGSTVAPTLVLPRLSCCPDSLFHASERSVTVDLGKQFDYFMTSGGGALGISVNFVPGAFVGC